MQCARNRAKATISLTYCCLPIHRPSVYRTKGTPTSRKPTYLQILNTHRPDRKCCSSTHLSRCVWACALPVYRPHTPNTHQQQHVYSSPRQFGLPRDRISLLPKLSRLALSLRQKINLLACLQKLCLLRSLSSVQTNASAFVWFPSRLNLILYKAY